MEFFQVFYQAHQAVFLSPWHNGRCSILFLWGRRRKTEVKYLKSIERLIKIQIPKDRLEFDLTQLNTGQHKKPNNSNRPKSQKNKNSRPRGRRPQNKK